MENASRRGRILSVVAVAVALAAGVTVGTSLASQETTAVHKDGWNEPHGPVKQSPTPTEIPTKRGGAVIPVMP